MSLRTYVFMPAVADAPIVWAQAKGDRVIWGEAPRDGSAPPPKSERMIAVAPGADVASFAVPLPTRSESQAREAAPFAIEDEIAESLSSVHVALGPRRKGDPNRTIAVVALTRMDEWRAALADCGAEPDIFIPDYLLLPSVEDTANVLALPDRVIIAFGGTGFSVDPDLAPLVIADTLEKSNISRARVYAADPTKVLGLSGAALEIEQEAALDTDGFIRLLSSEARDEGGLDLRQGAYAVRRTTDEAALLPWRKPAILAGVLLLGWTLLNTGQALIYSNMAGAAQTETETVFRDAFPDVRRVVNPRAQLRSKLAAMSGAGGDAFLEQTAILFAALKTSDAVLLDSLRYQEGQAGVTASITYGDYRDIEGLRVEVERLGGSLSEGGARRVGSQFSGDVTVTRQ